MKRLYTTALIGAGAVVAWLAGSLLGLLPSFPGTGGNGDGEKTPSETEVRAVAPSDPAPKSERAEKLTGPLEVTIRERAYYIDGKTVTISEIAERAKSVPASSHIKVVIVRDNTSRAEAELDLANALSAKDLVFEMKDRAGSSER